MSLHCAVLTVVAAIMAMFASVATAQPPPPPPDSASVVAASCSANRALVPFDPVPARITPLPPLDLGPTVLHEAWGVRIATGDTRVSDIAGMVLDNGHLLAVTRGGQWLTLDVQNGSLNQVRSVGVAAMRQLAGPPTSVVPGWAGMNVAYGGKHAGVATYALQVCGANAAAVPWLDITGSEDPIVVDAAYTYLGIVGRGHDGAALNLPYQRGAVHLAGVNPLGLAGHRLIAATNPARIVPEIITAVQVNGSPRTEIRLTLVDAWSDVQGGAPTPARSLATLSRTPVALASTWQRDGDTLALFVAMPSPSPGTIDIYRLDGPFPL